MTAIRAAYLEYLPAISMCECDTCRRKSQASQQYHRYGDTGSHAELVAMWATISDSLRELAEGRHVRVSIHERAVIEQEKNVAAGRPRYGAMPVQVRMSDFYATGMGLGVSQGIRVNGCRI